MITFFRAGALSELAEEEKKKAEDDKKADEKATEEAERVRLASEEGRVCFDLFAPKVGDLLHGSARIRRLIFSMYPVIILDEFQDTNDAQWRVVEALGEAPDDLENLVFRLLVDLLS